MLFARKMHQICSTSQSKPEIPDFETVIPARMVNAMGILVYDNLKRLQVAHTSKSVSAVKSAMKGGFWYPMDYIRAFHKVKDHFTAEDSLWLPSYAARTNPYLGHLSDDYFESVDFCSFKMRSEVTASQAVMAAWNGPFLGDCVLFKQLVMHKVLLETLGIEQYDAEFNGKLFFSRDSENLLKFIKLSEKTDEIARGTLCFARNHEAYLSKHLCGHHYAINVVSLGGGKFLGLGLPFKGVTVEEIAEYLATQFNRESERGTIPELGIIIVNDYYRPKSQQQITAADVPGIDPKLMVELDISTIKRALGLTSSDCAIG